MCLWYPQEHRVTDAVMGPNATKQNDDHMIELYITDSIEKYGLQLEQALGKFYFHLL